MLLFFIARIQSDVILDSMSSAIESISNALGYDAVESALASGMSFNAVLALAATIACLKDVEDDVAPETARTLCAPTVAA